MSYVDGSDYDGDTSASHHTNDSPELRSEFKYGDSASALEASISASAAPTTTSNSPGATTVYFGVSGSMTTPVGGAAFDAGYYFNKSTGAFGAYWDLGNSYGSRGLSLSVVGGETQSIAGKSISAQASAGGELLAGSYGVSIDPVTLQQTAVQYGFGLSLGPPIGASVSFVETETVEFTNVYSDVYSTYIQFLNWARVGQYGL